MLLKILAIFLYITLINFLLKVCKSLTPLAILVTTLVAILIAILVLAILLLATLLLAIYILMKIQLLKSLK